jgi:hypothetical protein
MMKKNTLLFLITCVNIVSVAFAQTDSFDVFTYQAPEFFTKSELPSRVQFHLTNKDGSFCTITLYKSLPAKENLLKVAMSQWNEQVVKRLAKADKKPTQILTGKDWDGWPSALSIGNFYQNKKKCVVMLYTFSNNKIASCAVYAFSDKSFKGPIELFSKNLHLYIQ